jgi:nitrite reductase/ring-hydroxylating ferredoxin subunit
VKFSLGKLTDFRPGEKRGVRLDNREILVLYLGGRRFFACQRRCPHLGCDLYETGSLIKEELVCQCHFTHFSIVDGRAIKGATKRPLQVYEVSVSQDEVQVSVPDE